MEEIWKPVVGFCNYEVSNLGNVRSVKRKIILAIFDNGRGYKSSTLGKKKMDYVHRLVAKAFIPNPDNKPQVNHINGIKHDNRVENLEWVTAQENMRHSYLVLHKNVSHKRFYPPKNGSLNGNNKLLEKDIIDISILTETMSRRELCNKYGIKISQLRKIQKGQVWKHVKRKIHD